VAEAADVRIDRDALAVEDARHLRAELGVALRRPALDPRLGPLLDRTVVALRDVAGERALEAALETFAPVTDVLAGWPAPPGARPRADGAARARRFATWADRRVLRLATVVLGLEALAFGPGSPVGRLLARESVELSRARRCCGAVAPAAWRRVS
jgi:hypothetical protein